MGTHYDENIAENPFYQQIHRNYEDIFKTASENNWIICIPRFGAIGGLELSRHDVLEHILIRNVNNNYQNLNRKEINKTENRLIYKNADNTEKIVRILFYEDFLVEKQKFTVWCIEEFLSNSTFHREEVIEINNFCDCINLLWTDSLGCYVLDEINSTVQLFLTHQTLQEYNLKQLQKTVGNLYDDCLKITVQHFEVKDDNFARNIKLAVESFMHACLKDRLFNLVCTQTAASDANLNKIIRNCQDVSLKSLSVDVKDFDCLPIAKLELNKINNSSIVLNKIICLRRVFELVNYKNAELLLRILIFLLMKSNICNWIANLVFITKFCFNENEEYEFLVTNLKAALKYITENDLSPLKTIDDSSNKKFNEIIYYIKDGDLNLLTQSLNYKSKSNETLCHPLCSCDSCEYLLKINTCELNSRDEKGRTFLHFAAKCDHPDIVHFLISEGSNINSLDYSDWTPLHYAVSTGNQHATFLLLHAGCNSNLKDFEGNTPLHIAVKNCHENCVEALLFFTNNNGENADVNCVNNNGDTPLHFAAKYGYLNLVKVLLEFRAKLLANKRNQTPLAIAHNVYVKETLLVENIIDNYVVIETDDVLRKPQDVLNVKKQYGEPPKDLNQIKKTDLLLKAIESNDKPLTCFYLGIPMLTLNNPQKNNCHPLCTCENCSNLSEEASIPAKTLNINACNPDGFTPLHVAAKFGRLDILRLILDAGALVNLKTCKNLYTPLHLAALNKRRTVVKELLKCGSCNVDVTDFYGNTPLHYACFNNDVEMFEMFLNEGADVYIRNKDGKTVRDIAVDRTFLNILKLLERDKKVCTEDFLL